MSDSTDPRQVLIFELGNFQAYSFQTPSQIRANAPYELVYWQEKNSPTMYGPFRSLYEAMRHYTGMEALQDNIDDTGDKPLAPVIYVDFMNKTRINHE